MEFSHNGLSFSVPDTVYQPAEDSFMLADAALGLSGNVLEIGCGSGVASLSAAKTSLSVLGVDINPDAVRCAAENAKKNQMANARFLESDLFSNVKGTYDAILFNPPYLPTDEGERLSGNINKAFDGGRDGRETLQRFLEQFDAYLKSDGVLLLVQSSLNDFNKTKDFLEAKGFSVEIIVKQSFFFEELYLLKASRT